LDHGLPAKGERSRRGRRSADHHQTEPIAFRASTCLEMAPASWRSELASSSFQGKRAAQQFPGGVQAAEYPVDDGLAQLADDDHVPLAQVEANLGALDEIPHGSQEVRSSEEQPSLLPLEVDNDLDAAGQWVGNRIVNRVRNHLRRLPERCR